jgi:hypothetical protein
VREPSKLTATILTNLDFGDEYAASTTLGADQVGLAGIGLQLAPQAQNLRVHAAVKDILMHSDCRQQLLAAKAAIALANEGGGAIVLGLREEGPDLISEPRPPEMAAYDTDLINGIIRRFASPSFHCSLTLLPHPATGYEHAVVWVPGGFGVPVMSKSGTTGNTIRPHLCYMRKPGPESAPPQSQADWERLLARCL